VFDVGNDSSYSELFFYEYLDYFMLDSIKILSVYPEYDKITYIIESQDVAIRSQYKNELTEKDIAVIVDERIDMFMVIVQYHKHFPFSSITNSVDLMIYTELFAEFVFYKLNKGEEITIDSFNEYKLNK